MRFLYLLLLLPWLARAQQALEIIPLKHRSAEQVLPVITPLLEPGAALTGTGNQLILRSSARNRQDILQVLAVIDVPARNLLIRVTQDRDTAMAGRGAQGRVAIGNNEVRASGRAFDTRSTGSAGSAQTVRVVEGGQAFINIGQSLPVRMQETQRVPGGTITRTDTVFRDLGQGFYAAPRVTGDRVTVEISTRFDTPGRAGPGSINSQQASTTVSGRLGEWIALGGSSQQAAGTQRGLLSAGEANAREQHGIWLMVIEAGP